MTIPSSTSTAARAYLFTQLAAQVQPDPNDVTASLLVCYDGPGPQQPADIVAVGKVHRVLSVGSMVGGGGAGWLDEKYTITVTVDVFRGGEDMQTAFTRCRTLTDEVIALVRTDPTLGGLVVWSRPITDSIDVEWDEGHMGPHAVGELEIECVQRI